MPGHREARRITALCARGSGLLVGDVIAGAGLTQWVERNVCLVINYPYLLN